MIPFSDYNIFKKSWVFNWCHSLRAQYDFDTNGKMQSFYNSSSISSLPALPVLYYFPYFHNYIHTHVHICMCACTHTVFQEAMRQNRQQEKFPFTSLLDLNYDSQLTKVRNDKTQKSRTELKLLLSSYVCVCVHYTHAHKQMSISSQHAWP